MLHTHKSNSSKICINCGTYSSGWLILDAKNYNWLRNVSEKRDPSADLFYRCRHAPCSTNNNWINYAWKVEKFERANYIRFSYYTFLEKKTPEISTCNAYTLLLEYDILVNKQHHLKKKTINNSTQTAIHFQPLFTLYDSSVLFVCFSSSPFSIQKYAPLSLSRIEHHTKIIVCAALFSFHFQLSFENVLIINLNDDCMYTWIFSLQLVQTMNHSRLSTVKMTP